MIQIGLHLIKENFIVNIYLPNAVQAIHQGVQYIKGSKREVGEGEGASWNVMIVTPFHGGSPWEDSVNNMLPRGLDTV